MRFVLVGVPCYVYEHEVEVLNMTENAGEHAMHHSHSKEGDFSAYVLPLSILLAAVIVGYSMISAAGALSTSLTGLNITTGTTSDQGTLPTPDQGQGQLAPTLSKTMAELAATDYAGKLGSDDAEIVLIEYSDLQCPFCRRFYTQTHQTLVDKYVSTGKVQYIYKDFPLSFHPLAPIYANAARCAGDQGKFWEMHHQIFDEQQKLDPSGGTVSSVTNDNIKAWAANIGLNASTFNACFDTNKYSQEIQSNFTEGTSIGVGGTPSFVVGLRDAKGQLIVGAQPTATFEAAIELLNS